MKLTGDALAFRSRAASDEYRRPSLLGPGQPGQAVFKVVGSRNDREGAQALVSYVRRSGRWAAKLATAEMGEGARYNVGTSGRGLVMRDEAGEPWTGEDPAAPGGVVTIGKAWELPDDHALAFRRFRRDRMLPGAERREPALVWHLIVSVRGLDGMTADQRAAAVLSAEMPEIRRRTLDLLEEAVRGFVFEAFAEAGRRALWVVHEDGTHPHAHIIARAENDEGRHLRFDKQGVAIDTFRETFARHARDCGLDVTAERREDRSEIREAVLAGTELARPHVGMAEKKFGRPDLALRVPHWYQADGEAFERRRLRDAERRLRLDRSEADPRAAWLAALPPAGRGSRLASLPAELDSGDAASRAAWQALFERLRPCFTDPAGAIRSYARMASEGGHHTEQGRVVYPSKALADWYLRHQPMAFGDITAAAVTLRRDRTLRGQLRGLRPPGVYEAPARALSAAEVRSLVALRGQADDARAAARVVSSRLVMVRSLSALASRSEEIYGPIGRVARIREAAARLAGGPLASPGAQVRPGAAPAQPAAPAAPATTPAPSRGLIGRLFRRDDREREQE